MCAMMHLFFFFRSGDGYLVYDYEKAISRTHIIDVYLEISRVIGDWYSYDQAVPSENVAATMENQ